MSTNQGRRGLRRRLVAAGAAVAAAGAVLVPAGTANAAEEPISGATTWLSPCNWTTSANVRYTSVANKTVRAKLSDTGKLGVKMRTLNVNTGSTSAIRYYPPLGSYQSLGSFGAKNSPFRLQFTCVTPRSGLDRPSTDFSGTLDR